MKRFVALMMCAVSLGAAAQFPNLPYNPDDNADGLIGVADLQALLANYGSEFSSAILSEDGESAIVYMGHMGMLQCGYACQNLPGYWTLPNQFDIVPVIDNIGTGAAWLKFDPSSERLRSDDQRYEYPFYDGGDGNIVVGYFITQNFQCYCTAKQMPRVEYSACIVNTAQTSNFLNCCAEKVSLGWYPLDNAPSGATNHFSQAFWRWAE